MQDFYVGCGPIPTRRRGYFDTFNALEISETWYEPIGLETLKQWRQEAGEGTYLALHIWRWIALDHLELTAEPPLGLPIDQVGLCRATDANAELWKTVREQADALDADAVWIRTPASLSPSKKNRQELEKFQQEIIGNVPFDIIWEARGMWDPDDVYDFAESLGWRLAIDPHQEFEFPEAKGSDGVYVHHQPRGRKNFDRDDCEDLLDIYEEHDGEVLAIFRGASRQRNAQRMKQAYEDRFGELMPE
jgi:uncharacterized protein YecE (DUF72 family)